MDLLPSDTLSGVRVGISASSSLDLGRLGLFEGHFRLALGELARAALVLGGNLQYCGHLAPDGYTSFLLGELKRYGRRDDPFSVLLAWSVHRRIDLREIKRARVELGLLGSITCLDLDGHAVDCADGRDNEPPGLPSDEVGPSLTSMRERAAGEVQGRVVIGGQRSGYQGVMPGVLEEVAIALEREQPVFLAGGFGGVTYDVVRLIDPEAATWLPDIELESDDGHEAGLNRIAWVVEGRSGWIALKNGLNRAENVRLATTHRPSEIASFVSLGLGRLARERGSIQTEDP